MKSGSRRRFLRGVAVFGGASLLAACGTVAPSQPTTASPTGEAAPAATAAPVQGDTAKTAITFWCWIDPPEPLIAGFMSAHPNITVDYVETPNADAHDKLLTSLAAGSGAPDVAALEISRVGSFTAKGGLVDLKSAPFDAGQFQKDVVTYKWTQGSAVDGRLVAMPWDIGPAGFWYRTDLFAAAGYPTEPEAVEELIGSEKKSWDEFFAFAKEFMAKSGGNTALFADAATDVYGAAYRQQGEGYIDGTKVLLEEKATRPFQLAQRARTEGLDANIEWWGAEWATGMKNDAFAGMMIACWQQTFLVREHPQTAGTWRVIRAPEANYNWGGSFMAIPEQSAQQEAAWEFVKYACASAEGQNALFQKEGIFPAYKPAWQDPLYDAPVEFFGGQRAYRVWLDIADNITASIRTPYDQQLDDIAWAELTKVLNENKDAGQAAKDAEAEALKRIEGTTA
jgi:multiple sugar transport system substrate-binding protein